MHCYLSQANFTLESMCFWYHTSTVILIWFILRFSLSFWFSHCPLSTCRSYSTPPTSTEQMTCASGKAPLWHESTVVAPWLWIVQLCGQPRQVIPTVGSIWPFYMVNESAWFQHRQWHRSSIQFRCRAKATLEALKSGSENAENGMCVFLKASIGFVLERQVGRCEILRCISWIL